jgi:hypothetical protein
MSNQETASNAVYQLDPAAEFMLRGQFNKDTLDLICENQYFVDAINRFVTRISPGRSATKGAFAFAMQDAQGLLPEGGLDTKMNCINIRPDVLRRIRGHHIQL